MLELARHTRGKRFPGESPWAGGRSVMLGWRASAGSNEWGNLDCGRHLSCTSLPVLHTMSGGNQYQYEWKILVDGPAFCTLTVPEQSLQTMSQLAYIRDTGL